MKKRTFLKQIAGAMVVTISTLSGFCAHAKKYALSRSQLPALEKVGGVSTIKLKGKQILLVRISKSKILGFDALCTHQACPLQYDNQQLRCKCHGSRFDMKGTVKNGPATKSLNVYPVTISNDKLIVG